MQVTMVHTCKYCGKQFGRKDNLNRHLHNIHSEEMSNYNSKSEHSTDDESLHSDVDSNHSGYDRDSDSDSDSHSDIETEEEGHATYSNVVNNHNKIDIWHHFIYLTYEAKEEALKDLVLAYRENDPEVSLEDLRDEAFAEMKPEYVKHLRHVYTDFMKKMYALQRNQYHRKIMRTAKRLREDEGFSKDEATQYAAKKRKYLLEQIMDSYKLPEIEYDEDSIESDHTSSDEEQNVNY